MITPGYQCDQRQNDDIGHGHGHGFDRINISYITIYQYFDNEGDGGQLC